MRRSDAFDKSPVESLLDLAVIESDLVGRDRPISLAEGLISTPAPSLPRTGAVALMTAVLEEAVRSCFSATPQIRAEAEAWLTSGQRQSIFSFLAICETLGLDAEATRVAVARLVAISSTRKAVRRTRATVRHNLLSSGLGPRRTQHH